MGSEVPSSNANASSRRKFRQIVFRVHTWLGLQMCIILGLLFFSGVLALFAPEMEIGARSDLYVSPSSTKDAVPDYGAMYDTVLAQDGVGSVVAMHSPARPWFGHMVEYKTTDGANRLAWMHPATGDLLGTSRPDPLYIKEFVLRLHDTFMIPMREVHYLVMAFSLVLLASIISGLITYRRFWKGLFRWPDRAATTRNRQGAWHRLIAVWMLPFLLIMAFTSFAFLVVNLFIKPYYAPVSQTSEREVVLPEGFDGETLNAWLDRVRAELPTYEAKFIGIPQTKYRPFSTYGYETDRLKMMGTVSMRVDPMTEDNLGIVRAYSDSAMAVVVSLAESWHFGAFASGVWAVILWAVFGIISCMLFLTGARIYAARTITEAGGSLDGKGTFGIVWQGLGIFRWAYVLFGLAVLGSTVAQAI